MSVLRERGYLTAGFVSSVVLGRKSGLQDHFEHFDDELSTPELNRPQRYERPAKATVSAALAYLEGRPATRPFFLWIHLIDPHGPYRPLGSPTTSSTMPSWGAAGSSPGQSDGSGARFCPSG
jgi:hypothetical protein